MVNGGNGYWANSMTEEKMEELKGYQNRSPLPHMDTFTKYNTALALGKSAKWEEKQTKMCSEK